MWIFDPDRPESQWCDMDYVAWYIGRSGYVPDTTMENLVANCISHYDLYLTDNDIERYLEEEDRRPYPLSLMIDWVDIGAFVYDSGGWHEFDYWV